MAEGGLVDLSSVSTPDVPQNEADGSTDGGVGPVEPPPNTLSPALNPNCSTTGPLAIVSGLMQLVVA